MKLFGSTDLLDRHARATVQRQTQPFGRTHDGSVGGHRAHDGGGVGGRCAHPAAETASPPLGEPRQKSPAVAMAVSAPKRPSRDTMYLRARRRGDERADAWGAGPRAAEVLARTRLCTAGLVLAAGAPRTVSEAFLARRSRRRTGVWRRPMSALGLPSRSNRAPCHLHEARDTGCEVHGTGSGTNGRIWVAVIASKEGQHEGSLFDRA